MNTPTAGSWGEDWLRGQDFNLRTSGYENEFLDIPNFPY